MKIKLYFHIILFLLFALFMSCDKYVISEDQQLSFIKYYGLNVENEGGDMEKTSDGYIIVGNSNNVGNNRDIVIFTTDEYGNLTGEINTIGSSNDDEVLNIVPVENDHFLICARTLQGLNNWDQYLIKINSAGNVIWEDTYDFKTEESSDFSASENSNAGVDAVYLNNSNEYVVVGYITDDNGIRHSWNGRWNLAGTIVGKPRASNSGNQELTGVHLYNNQTYVVGHILNGETYDIFQAGLQQPSGQLFGLNYYSSLNNTSQNNNEYAVDIIGDNNNRLILGYYEDDGLDIPFLVNYVRRDENNFDKNWELFIREDDIESVNSVSINNNEILILANSPETSAGYEMKIIRTSLNATNYSTFNFGEEGVRLRGNTIMQLNDGVGIVGNSLIGDNSSIIFMKLRPDLTLTPE